MPNSQPGLRFRPMCLRFRPIWPGLRPMGFRFRAMWIIFRPMRHISDQCDLDSDWFDIYLNPLYFDSDPCDLDLDPCALD